MNSNNKTEISDNHIEIFNYNDKILVLNNKKIKYNQNINNIKNISPQNKMSENSKSCNKSRKKEDIKKNIRKLYYINRKNITTKNYNSNNNSNHKKNQIIMKIKTNTRNIELNDIGPKKKFCATFNNKGNGECKSKSKSKSKSKQNSKNKKKE